jgi:hypothetical protein
MLKFFFLDMKNITDYFINTGIFLKNNVCYKKCMNICVIIGYCSQLTLSVKSKALLVHSIMTK